VTVLSIWIFFLGTILARFFKIWILIPVILGIAAATIASCGYAPGPLYALLKFAFLTTCLQIGYVSGLFSSMIPGLWQRRKTKTRSLQSIAVTRHR